MPFLVFRGLSGKRGNDGLLRVLARLAFWTRMGFGSIGLGVVTWLGSCVFSQRLECQCGEGIFLQNRSDFETGFHLPCLESLGLGVSIATDYGYDEPKPS